MPDELEERLKSHARAFDSLLSLIPAKLYYGEDVSDQWKRKKQTTEQKRAAKKAKLDPDNWKSAKDVMDEREAAALKRKREEDEHLSDGGVDLEKPKLVQDQEKSKSKRRKTEVFAETETASDQKNKASASSENVEDKKRRKVEQKAAKRERKQARQAKLRERKEKLKNRKKGAKGQMADGEKKQRTQVDGTEAGDENDDEDSDQDEMAEAIQIDGETAKNLSIMDRGSHSTVSPSPVPESPILSPHIHSSTSSISSVQPSSTTNTIGAQQKELSSFEISPAQQDNRPSAKERFNARLTELRIARKAEGPEAKPARNRHELLEERRRKEADAKKAKKEQRKREKEEELKKQEEEIAKRFSPGGSGSLLASPRSPMVENDTNFSFGRVAFGDGSQADATLSTLLEQKRKKGPADVATALQRAKNKASRLSGYDEAKKKEIEEKDMWLNAKKRAHGERVRDDTSLLKKALKRQESIKKKSGTEWQDRIEGVAKGQEIRQKKRERNLQQRKEEKGGKGKGKGSSKKIKRPGFEGSFRGRTGGGKKKS